MMVGRLQSTELLGQRVCVFMLGDISQGHTIENFVITMLYYNFGNFEEMTNLVHLKTVFVSNFSTIVPFHFQGQLVPAPPH